MDTIINGVCNHYSVTINELKSTTRVFRITNARQIAMYLLSNRTKLTSTFIGEEFGRDHATVLHAVKKINGLLDVDKEFQAEILEIECKLDGKVIPINKAG